MKSNDAEDETVARLRVEIRGAVQGVGFRPFVYRLAQEIGLSGWVRNSPRGVTIEAEGAREALTGFLLRLEREKPPRASIHSLESSFLDPTGHRDFQVRPSDDSGEKTSFVLPDIATCADCLAEIRDPANRRYRYPFTNCTNCGPRFSIIEALPYDRPNTTMKRFAMCERCRREYEDPGDRRFHAQPNACPECGPHLELWDRDKTVLATEDKALRDAAQAIAAGKIAAVKGLGGFHLVADAFNEAVVRELRRRKRREEKPFALMYPSLEAVRGDCHVDPLEERLLLSPESPIVLLHRRAKTPCPATDAPDAKVANPYLGVMLPYTPLHHLLMQELGAPVIATSGNLADEPICTDEIDAVVRLGGVADLFLVHDRPIARHVDDSIARIVAGREIVLRRARGFAPLPVTLGWNVPPVLAVGAHLKNSVAVGVGDCVFVSQHVGDLDTAEACDAFRRVASDMQHLHDLRPSVVARDLHPDYASTRHAARVSEERSIPSIAVQHHHAHVWSVMAENRIEGPALGVAWDGTGYGLDGTVWGGEFFLVDEAPASGGGAFDRVAHLRTFRLPGGEAAVREPRRSALGLLYERFGDSLFEGKQQACFQTFSDGEIRAIATMLRRGLHSPLTSSAGRLFDAVASLVDLRQVNRFEGQAAMELEFALDGVEMGDAYPFELADRAASEGPGGAVSRGAATQRGPRAARFVVDWAATIEGILEDLRRSVPIGIMSARFHNALVEMILAVAERVERPRVALSGGCFQNKYLTERTVRRLREKGFHPYWHQRIPPNDGGIALGQAVAATRSG
jgi:hydrogenase maturation protein HypF